MARYRPRSRRPPSQTWKPFLTNHIDTLTSIDFCVVPTSTFRLLFVFVMSRHDGRRFLHFGNTEDPTAAGISGQLKEAFPFNAAPRYLIRDRDRVYGKEVRRRLEGMGIKEVVIASHSPW